MRSIVNTETQYPGNKPKVARMIFPTALLNSTGYTSVMTVIFVWLAPVSFRYFTVVKLPENPIDSIMIFEFVFIP